MTRLRDQLLAALDDEFRTSVDIARRAGVEATQAAPALGYLRQEGIVESTAHGAPRLWRLRQPPRRRDLSPAESDAAWR